MKSSSIRIIAGTLKGRRVPTYEGLDIRPTAERVREALFSILSETIRGAKVLDAFAGTGAIGLEALSRGASEVVFVEHNVTAVTSIEKTLTQWSLGASGRVFKEEVLLAIRNPNLVRYRPFDVLYIDPPYRLPDIEQLLVQIEQADLMAPQATIIHEHPSRHKVPSAIGSWNHYRTERYGHSSISFYQPRVSHG